MDRTHDPSTAHVRPRPLPAILLGSFLLIASCASPPRAVAPTTLAGNLPEPAPGREASATAPPESPKGPIRLFDAAFTWERGDAHGASFRWRCRVSNPSHRTVRVTLVMQVLDGNGRPLHTDDQSFLLEGDDRLEARGDGSLEADEAARAASWRLEYWVRLVSPPRRPGGWPTGGQAVPATSLPEFSPGGR